MPDPAAPTILYKRASFATRLPASYLYNPSHFWVATDASGRLRIGFTKFATRMLGEIVEHAFQAEPGATVRTGEVIGWIEGFKAISDLYCIADGEFAGGNPALAGRIELLDRDPYGEGWLYSVQGKPDARCTDVEGYIGWLDKTIDGMQQETHSPEPNEPEL